MTIFRPTCRVRLQVRLDEGRTGVSPSAVSSLPGLGAGSSGIASALAKNAQERKILGLLKRKLSPPQWAEQQRILDDERDRLQAAATGAKQRYPAGVDPARGVADDGTVIFEVLPASAVVTRSPTKDADTAQVSFNFRDLPIDPRCVRAALVIVTLGTVRALDYADGMADRVTRADGSLLSLVEHENGQELRLNSTSRFTGFASTWEINCDDSGDVVTLDCVDVSAVLRVQLLHGKTIDLHKPIDQGVQELIDSFPTSAGLRVVLGTPIDGNNPDRIQEFSGVYTPADVMPPVMKRRKKRGQAVAPQKSEKQTVWDHINDVCLRLGLVPVMRGFVLYLMEPRVLFRGLLGAKRMVYGRNVLKMKLKRKLEGLTTDTIEVRCPDRTIGRVRWARYPVLKGEPKSGILGAPGSPQPVVSRSSNVTPNGTGHEQIRTLTVRGVSDLATLERVAESTWHEISRQEIQGSFATHDLESWESETEGDLLNLQSGEPIQLLVEQPADGAEAGVSSYQELVSLSAAARAKHLEGWGITAEVARRLAMAQEQIVTSTAFRCGYVTLRWSAEDGVAIDCDFFNFIVVREDAGNEGDALGSSPKTLGAALNAKS